MKTFTLFFIAILCLSFRPTSEKNESNAHNGFYITVEDHTNRSYHKFLVNSKDSVNIIFNQFFNSELELGEVDRPISIFNGKRDFYIARVTLYEKPNGKKGFKHLKYPAVYENPKKALKRSQLKPVYL